MILRLITLAKFIMNKPPVMKRWLIMESQTPKEKLKSTSIQLLLKPPPSRLSYSPPPPPPPPPLFFFIKYNTVEKKTILKKFLQDIENNERTGNRRINKKKSTLYLGHLLLFGKPKCCLAYDWELTS